MELGTNLAAGVLSSLIAVALIELYLVGRRLMRERRLRRLLARSDRVVIVTPEYPSQVSDRVGSLLATHDAIALAHLLEVCHRVKASSVLAPASRLPEDAPPVTVSIGGPWSNTITSYYLTRYCGQFRQVENTGERASFEVPGAHRFDEDSDITWSFVVRIDPEVTGRSGTVLLVWGTTAIATAAAAHVLANNTAALPWRRRSFFVALAVDTRLGYRSVQREPTDISGIVFGGAEVTAGLPDRP